MGFIDFLKEVARELEKAKQMNVDGHWTFAHVTDLEWCHDAFETKEQALAEAKAMFSAGYAVGQLEKTEDEMVYNVVNIEKFILN